MSTTLIAACSISARTTGKERDSESGLDYMDARYYGSSMGRFMSPDPVFATVNRLYDPQQWNMYSYGRNNPLSNSDPTGLDFNITGCGSNSATCQNNLFGTTSTDANGKSSFTATVLSNDANGGLVDQNGNSYNGTFDQSGFHFSNSDGSVSGGGQFIHDSAETDLAGSGVFSGTEGRFNSDCGGSCQGKGSISDIVAGSGAVQSAKDAFGLSKEDAFNIFGGHGKAENYRGPGEQDAHIVQHLAGRDNGKTELHFEGHPPGRDLVNFVLHQVDAIHDFVTHESRKEPALP